jgi:hypothetical protein
MQKNPTNPFFGSVVGRKKEIYELRHQCERGREDDPIRRRRPTRAQKTLLRVTKHHFPSYVHWLCQNGKLTLHCTVVPDSTSDLLEHAMQRRENAEIGFQYLDDYPT